MRKKLEIHVRWSLSPMWPTGVWDQRELIFLESHLHSGESVLRLQYDEGAYQKKYCPFRILAFRDNEDTWKMVVPRLSYRLNGNVPYGRISLAKQAYGTISIGRGHLEWLRYEDHWKDTPVAPRRPTHENKALGHGRVGKTAEAQAGSPIGTWAKEAPAKKPLEPGSSKTATARKEREIIKSFTRSVMKAYLMNAWQQLQFHHRAAFSSISEALELDSSGRSSDALPAYKKGIRELKKGLSVNGPDLPKDRRESMLRLKAKMKVNLEMAQERVSVISRSRVPIRTKSLDRKDNAVKRSPLISRRPTAGRPPSQAELSRQPKVEVSNLKNIDSKLKQIVLEQVIKGDSTLSLDDVVGNEVAKKSLFETVVLPAKNPDLFTGLRSPVQGLLLFGPPGNGKTMLAQAAAGQSGYVFFSISAASLMSKWVGEAEKLVQALFAVARAVQPSIIFIDEIDSILRERSDSEHDVSRRLKTEFLLQFDGVNSKTSDRVLVIGATNRPFDLDEAVLRRLPKRLYIPLPDRNDRVKMLRTLLRQQNHTLTDYAFNEIGNRTERFSFSDLKNLAKEAAMEPLRELPADRLNKIKVDQLRPLRVADFLNALRQCRPSVKADHIERLQEFNHAHGQTC